MPRARLADMEAINEYESVCHRCGYSEYVYGTPHTPEQCERIKPIRSRAALDATGEA